METNKDFIVIDVKLLIELHKKQLKEKGISFVPDVKTQPELVVYYEDEFGDIVKDIFIRIPGKVK